MIEDIVAILCVFVLLFVFIQWQRLKTGDLRIHWPRMPERWPTRGEIVGAALLFPRLVVEALALTAVLLKLLLILAVIAGGLFGAIWLLHRVADMLGFIWAATG
jgi:hypothetical protein